MNRKSTLHGRAVLINCVLLFSAHSLMAASGAWTGISDGYWTNSTNWSSSPYAGSGAGETATFTNSTGATTLDLSGLGSILNVVFDTGAAAYTIGGGSDKLVLENNGQIQIAAGCANDQAVGADIQMGPDGGTATYYLRSDNAGQSLAVNKMLGTTGGAKSLRVTGSGPVSIAGDIDRVSSQIDFYLDGTGVLTLSGNNALRQLNMNGANGVINLAAGNTTVANGGGYNLVASEDCTINGPGKITLGTGGGVNYGDNGAETGKTLTINAKISGQADAGFEYWHATYRGTIALLGANDYPGITIMNVPGTIMVTNINNNGTVGNLGAGNAFRHNGAGSRLLYTGVGQNTTRTIEMYQDGIIEQAGTGNLNFTTPIVLNAGGKTLTLQGSTAGTGEWSGALQNSAGTLNVAKAGTGTWTLSADNTYSGSTAVNEGTLRVAGSAGALKNTAGITLAAGATLQLYNAAGAANADRIRNAAAITMNGATLDFANGGGAASFSETVGTVNLNSGANTISSGQAALGQTSTLTISSLNFAGGTVDFTGTGLGDGSGQNKIVITGHPDGMIGTWATVNGTAYAAYSSALGVYASAAVPTGIAARGPSSVIPDDFSAEVIINDEGTDGPITLEGAFTNTTFILEQATNTAAVVQTVIGPTNKTFQVSTLKINAGRAALTIGENEGDGTVMPQNAGGTLELRNDSTAELTLNAAVADNASASKVIKEGSGDVRLTGANTYTGPTEIKDGTLIIDGASTQTLPGIISGAGALAKEGAGTLTLTGNNSYQGVTTISEGVVYAQNNNCFGAKSAGLVIEPGGAMEVGGTIAGNSFTLDGETVTVSGSGVGGNGAIMNLVGGEQHNAVRLMTLAGDTTLRADVRWDIRSGNNINSTLDMNGYDITKVGNQYFVLVGTAVNPGAGNIDVQQGYFSIEGSTDMNGDSNNVLRVYDGAYFDYWNQNVATDWTLRLDNNGRVNSRDGDAPGQNQWNGPVSLAGGTAILQGGGGTSYSFNGQISGSGGINKTGDVWVYLTATNNSYTGNTTVNQGLLHANNAGAIPDYAKVTVNNGNDTLAVLAGDGTNGWSNAQIKDLHDAATFADADSYLAFDLANGDLDYPYNFPVPMGISVMNGGELTIPDGQSLRSGIRIYSGSLVLNDIYNNVTNKTCFVGVNNGDFGELTLSGNSKLIGYVPASSTGTQTLRVGESGKGILRIQDNAVVTNMLVVGANGSGVGAVYQTGGTFENIGANGNDGRLGFYGYGYYELSGGYYRLWGYSQFGIEPDAIGIMELKGGVFEVSSPSGFSGNLGLSRGGKGILLQTGGLFTTPATLEIGDEYDNGTTGGYAEYAIEGGEAVITSDIMLANRNNMFAAMNLNGGVVSANRIYKATRTGSKAYVNFDGGTYQERNGGAVIDSGTGAPDAVTVYAGGAKIDTQSYTCSMPVPMLAPEGQGVASIAVAPTAGYIGPPLVTISGGGGQGATASAEFDSASGTLTGITVTSPGFGYTSVPTVALSGGGIASQPAATASLGANVSGGLTKLGSGSLVMTAANTYTGVTVISNGVFKLGLADALPAGNDISVDGGTYDLGGFTVTNGDVTVTSGAIINGTLVSGSLTKSESGDLILNVPLQTTDPVAISGGYVKLGRNIQPGLYEGSVVGNVNTTDINPATDVELSMVMADSTSGWPNNTTYIYSGYIWNNESTNVTWTFAENFDDKVRLYIDGNLVLNNDSWNTPTKANYVLKPGAHKIEGRFGQGTGGAGPVDSSWFVTGKTLGFVIDFQGRNAEVIGNYEKLVDPGDGSLLTTELASNKISTVEMEIGSILDLSGDTLELETLSAAGTVSNGTLVVNDTLAPGGIDTIGTLSVDASLTVNANVLIDVAADGSSDLLEVAGDLDLSSAMLTVANPEDLDTTKQYTIIACGGTITAPFASVSVGDTRWKVAYKPDGTARLIYVSGTLIILR